MSKKTYICINTVVGYDDLEGRYTKRPGEAIKLDPTDKETVRMLGKGAIRLDGAPAVEAPAVDKEPMGHVDTSGDDDGLGGDETALPAVDDGLGGDDSKTVTPPAVAEKPLTAAQKKAAEKAASNKK